MKNKDWLLAHKFEVKSNDIYIRELNESGLNAKVYHCTKIYQIDKSFCVEGQYTPLRNMLMAAFVSASITMPQSQ